MSPVELSEVKERNSKMEKVTDRILKFIRKSVEDAKAEGVVVGVSGGVDSACVVKLCTLALGKEKVFALIMPEKGVTPEEDVEDAVNLCNTLGIEKKIIEISPAVLTLCKLVECTSNSEDKRLRIAFGNMKPRVRMILLYYYANTMNRLVAGTGNKSELLAGYFTKYGDGGVDILPIGDLYKTEVFELADFLEIPENIRKKKPSARLWLGQTDEGEMGISYSKLDSIFKCIERSKFSGFNGFEILEKISEEDLKAFIKKVAESTNTSLEEVKLAIEMVKRSKHKREMPPCVRLRDLIG